MGSRRRLSEVERQQAEIILAAIADEYKTTVERLCARSHYVELHETRKKLYMRLRTELRLTYPLIGQICNRSEDSISKSFQEDGNFLQIGRPKQPSQKREKQANGVRHPKVNGDADIHDRLVTTWLSKEDDIRLRKLLTKHKVSQEDMVRGIIVDALHDEESRAA